MGVVLKRVGRAVTLRIEDDGIGFDPQVSVSIEHVGLLAMKDSVEMLGGKITVKSAPGRGTRIEVRCPSVVYGGN
jgi:NarL family two-component system sensor histidine kinase LiaS